MSSGGFDFYSPCFLFTLATYGLLIQSTTTNAKATTNANAAIALAWV